MKTTYISETEIISHLPEYILKTEKNQRVVITKGNNPVAALVNIRDFRQIEQKEQREEGLASVMDKWDNFDEIGDILADETALSRTTQKKKEGSAFLQSIAAIGVSEEDDISEQDEEILKKEISSVHGWHLNQ